ncbi:Lethal [Danaus plexippus plexippus]|uniref:Lethal n=1 Tax=Danaus plexippus plexippus TaxID=278856 RepID=A0A212FNT9_DANPL|nr:Lethal [Danaus plexippus plexippus]
MERQQCNTLQNFDDPKTEILKKRLLKASSTSTSSNLSQSNSHNVLLNTLRAPSSSSMIVSSVQAPQNSMPITHNLVTHSIAPVKIHTNNSPYPLQLSTVHVPVQIPGSTSNINVPVQLSSTTTSMPLQIAPVSLPLQVSGTTSVPVQLPAGDTINVPLQIPASNQNIQLGGSSLPSMPLLQTTTQPLHSSIIHVHMGNRDGTDMNLSNTQLQMPDSVKMNIPTSVAQMQMGSNSAVMQIPNSSNNSIQLTLPNSGNTAPVTLRGAARSVPHVVYIQTPTGLKPVTSTEVISQASTSGNPPQIIVRRPVTNNSNIHLISNVSTKPNIAPKVAGQHKSSILAPANSAQPIVIQKPKATDKMMVPVSIAPGGQPKQAIAYLSSVKKPTKNISESQSILISSNQSNVNSNNQKLYLTPMNVPKIQNTKFILPVTLPATMASKGPIINLQIANGQIQNDPQGNITVMRDTTLEASDLPPLQPLAKIIALNGKDNCVPHSPKTENGFTLSIPGSRAEPTGEQGEYTLSIPETNASMNDDIYTVSIADEEDGHTREQSFTLAIPEKGKSLLNRTDMVPLTTAAPAILRRSNSDNSDRKTVHANIKRRVSLCTDNSSTKNYKECESFSWETYLSETMACAVPARAFKTRPPVPFKPGMKLEVVDRRVPFLIRVATISAVKEHQVRVSFDGWPDELSCWLDDDSPDLHPVGWCLKTGHPLEPPLTAEELRIPGPCGVGGCRGLGSVHGGGLKQHAAASACPYRALSKSKSISTSTPTSDAPKEKLPRGRPPKHKRVEAVTKNDPVSDDESLSSGGCKRWRGSCSEDMRALRSASSRRPPSTQSSHHLPNHPAPSRALLARHVADLDLPSDPSTWTQRAQPGGSLVNGVCVTEGGVVAAVPSGGRGCGRGVVGRSPVGHLPADGVLRGAGDVPAPAPGARRQGLRGRPTPARLPVVMGALARRPGQAADAVRAERVTSCAGRL